MKRWLYLILLIMVANLAFGQKEKTNNSHATLRNSVEEAELFDEALNVKYVLDSAQIIITALDASGKVLWQTDPWLDNKLEEHRVKRPVILRFEFAKSKQTGGKEVIWIVYNNTQFGTIDKQTGKFNFKGQD